MHEHPAVSVPLRHPRWTENPGDAATQIRARLKKAELRPTRQRIALASLLFAGQHRHVTAEQLHQDAMEAGGSLSLATVYNTLHQFAEAGLLRRFAVDGARTYYDTNVGDHHHFYVEEEGRIIDIPEGSLELGRLPKAPEGYVITKVDVVIRLKRIGPTLPSAYEPQASDICCGDDRLNRETEHPQ